MTRQARPGGGRWEWRSRALPWPERPVVMGILNLTPDSFSDGGRFFDRERAVARARAMVAEGADIVDVGAESTRPGAEGVSAAEELDRLIPVLERLLEEIDVPISVDTSKAEVARAVLGLGCHAINDVRALGDGAMAEVIADAGAGVVLMHMKGEPRTMQASPHYEDVVGEVRHFLEGAIKRACAAGIASSGIVVDPGIGFGKTVDHNIELLARLDELADLGVPVLVGTSRKSFIGSITGRGLDDRLAGSIASVAISVLRGTAGVRVHDVPQAVDSVRIAALVERAGVSREAAR
ncbi:MAG: dihydropteroate synthase [Gemmatimonadetes bacterium]|nr:dihydropteroate synthase [Gemmatimonadota bacterium]